MSLVDGNGSGLSAADVAAVVGNGGTGFGNWGGDGAWWLLILFLFGIFGNGFGNGYGGNGMAPYMFTNTNNDVQRGFDQAAVIGQLNGIQSSINSGFSNAEVANCNREINSMQTAYSNQIASMNQSFANQQALNAQLNAMQMAQQNCCCENRAGIADLKYTVATEACADRNAISNALRDVIESNAASTQKILDTMCQDKIDAKNERIAELQNQLAMAQLQASQTAQTAAILSDNSRQTTALEQYLNPTPIPAYVVQNPNGCGCPTLYNSFGACGTVTA